MKDKLCVMFGKATLAAEINPTMCKGSQPKEDISLPCWSNSTI